MADTDTSRKPDHPVDRLFVDRWSPRAFTGEDIPVETLMTMFEAARWSPSSYNSQPWRIVWARKGTAHFDTLLGLLTGQNPAWAKDASALAIIASSKTMMVPNKDEPVPSHSHSFDAGAAWMSLALQARMLGWHTHGMVGVDWDKAARELGIPDGFRLEAAIAIGRIGDKSKLPDFFQAREMPNGRNPVGAFAYEGRFTSH